MKVIGIIASPRRNANTETIVEAVLNGAKKNGAQTRLVNLGELDVHGCLGCEACKKQLGKCVQKDDITPLLQDLRNYDAIILGTPVYWFHVTAQFKMLVDRLYCFLDYGKDPETGKDYYRFEFPAGKKFVMVISRGDYEPAELFPQFYDHLNEWLNMVPLSLSAGNIEFIHQYGAEIDRKAAKNDISLMEKAESIGGDL